MQAHEQLFRDEYGCLVPFSVIERRQQEQEATEREAMRRREQVHALREELGRQQAAIAEMRKAEAARLQKERRDRRKQWERAEARRAERAERKAAKAAEKEAREAKMLANYERIRSLGGFQRVEDKPSSDEEEDEGENGDDENVGGGGEGGGDEDDEVCPANITPAMWRQREFRGEPMANPCEGCEKRGIDCVAYANPKSRGAHVCWGCATRHKTCNPVDKTVPVNQKGRRTKNRRAGGRSEVVRSEVAENAETTNILTSQVEELGNLTGRIEEVEDALEDLKDKEEGTEARVSELVAEVAGLRKAVASMQAALSVEFVTLAERVRAMMDGFGGLAEGSGVGLKRKREESSEEEDEDEDEEDEDEE
ncbi:hypothetical protein ONZ45_g15832 [Pleurotus djamor]|nr:hypothetical protein ONZ45_g15832 [Pleurotus djamor]